LAVDVTQRKKVEEQLMRQEAELAATGRMAEIGGWEFKLGAAGPTWSEMVYRIHEVPLGENVSLQAALDFFLPESRTMVETVLAAALKDGQSFDFVAPLFTAKGGQRWVRSIGEPEIIDGKITRIVGALQDVTLQKQLEAELSQARKLESIGQLSAGIAHEINTPTQFIGNNVEFVKDALAEILEAVAAMAGVINGNDDGISCRAQLASALARIDLEYLSVEVPRALEQSLEGIDRIQRIVGAMKEFSHPAVEKTLVDINRAIDSTVIVASNEWKYVAELKTEFDTTLPQVLVMPGSFNQVILNIIVNAAHAIGDVVSGDATGKGLITVTTRRIDDWAEVRIQDTGGGIPEDIRDRIFDPFFTTKPVGKGTGQGLSIAHDVIVKKHDGMLAVESVPGRGTTFIVRLPLEKQASKEIAVA
jgi:signal transduction histidine kinase